MLLYALVVPGVMLKMLRLLMSSRRVNQIQNRELIDWSLPCNRNKLLSKRLMESSLLSSNSKIDSSLTVFAHGILLSIETSHRK